MRLGHHLGFGFEQNNPACFPYLCPARAVENRMIFKPKEFNPNLMLAY
jgi:hypothetical protein